MIFLQQLDPLGVLVIENGICNYEENTEDFARKTMISAQIIGLFKHSRKHVPKVLCSSTAIPVILFFNLNSRSLLPRRWDYDIHNGLKIIHIFNSDDRFSSVMTHEYTERVNVTL